MISYSVFYTDQIVFFAWNSLQVLKEGQIKCVACPFYVFHSNFYCTRYILYLRLLFAIFFFFYQIIDLKLWKIIFISYKKLFSFWRNSNLCNFFPFLSTFSRFKRTNESGIIYISWIGMEKLANVILGISQKPLSITSSNLAR